jgi:hypothetical protein
LHFVPQSHEQVSTLSTRVGPQSVVVSQAHAHRSAFQAKPAAQVAFSTHTHAHASLSQVSSTPQPPQDGKHCTSQASGLQNSGTAIALASPQLSGHSYEHVVTFQTKFGPGGGVVGVALQSKRHASALHSWLGEGVGRPQSAGHSQAHAVVLQVPTSHPPQSAGQAYSHVDASHTADGPGGAEPQSLGHVYSHSTVSHTKLGPGDGKPAGGVGHSNRHAA